MFLFSILHITWSNKSLCLLEETLKRSSNRLKIQFNNLTKYIKNGRVLKGHDIALQHYSSMMQNRRLLV